MERPRDPEHRLQQARRQRLQNNERSSLEQPQHFKNVQLLDYCCGMQMVGKDQMEGLVKFITDQKFVGLEGREGVSWLRLGVSEAIVSGPLRCYYGVYSHFADDTGKKPRGAISWDCDINCKAFDHPDACEPS